MENQESHRPANLPCPQHPWREIAVEGIAIYGFISNAAEDF
jgi:hypothetical protein